LVVGHRHSGHRQDATRGGVAGRDTAELVTQRRDQRRRAGGIGRGAEHVEVWAVQHRGSPQLGEPVGVGALDVDDIGVGALGADEYEVGTETVEERPLVRLECVEGGAVLGEQGEPAPDHVVEQTGRVALADLALHCGQPGGRVAGAGERGRAEVVSLACRAGSR
jgi:hypothetical protein